MPVKKKEAGLNEPQIDEDLADLVARQHRPMRLDAILRIARIGRRGKKLVENKLQDLEGRGILTRLRGGLWVASNTLKSVTGIFRALPNGEGIIEPAGIHVRPEDSGGAWDRDRVRAVLLPGHLPPVGRVEEILEKGQQTVFARVESRHGKTAHCRPLDRRMKIRFDVQDEGKRLKPDMLVILEPLRQLATGLWQAIPLETIAGEGRIEIQEAIIKSAHGVPAEFPQLALEQAESFSVKLPKKEMEAREDWRHLPFVTIDGEDARDFDDAFFVEQTDSGWILRVAIADVSHYVHVDSREGSLDAEAARRGNSWYFPRSVEPMLPAMLSNGLCSLKPGEERFAIMVEMPFSFSGITGDPRFTPICMCSAQRLTYPQVDAYFEQFACKNARGVEFAHKNAAMPMRQEVADMLRNAFSLYEILAKNRKIRGTLDFDLPEPAYVFDDSGNLKEMTTARITDANKLVEEFMIAANEAVAGYLERQAVPFLFRDHPKPELARLTLLLQTLANIAPEVLPPNAKPATLADSKVIQGILKRASGKPYEYAVNRLCLRAMPQARYEPENTGHFGIASQAYCHFTSPIRRYADLLTHRALKVCIGRSSSEAAHRYDKKELWQIGTQLNRLEREAMECEREIARRMACIALADRVGSVMEGTISGVMDFGLFVELRDIPAEGLIHMRDLGSGWFDVDQQKQLLIGKHDGQVWRLGQRVKVRIASIDSDRMEISLVPIDMGNNSHNKGRHTATARKISRQNNVRPSLGKGKRWRRKI